MSSYKSMAVNPKTNTIEEAFFLDDHYGKHKYGVLFSDGNIYPEEKVSLSSEVAGAIEQPSDSHSLKPTADA